MYKFTFMCINEIASFQAFGDEVYINSDCAERPGGGDRSNISEKSRLNA